jgi:hypothetical protein
MNDTSRESLLPELENLCPECEGQREWPLSGRCFTCAGVGYIPTPLGERILRLVQHNMLRLRRTEEP